MNDREALEKIARLLLEEADYDYDPCSQGPEMACHALGWEFWSCTSKFTSCCVKAIGPRKELETAGWVLRNGRERCPVHARRPDPSGWNFEAPHPDPRFRVT